MKTKTKTKIQMTLCGVLLSAALLTGCNNKSDDSTTTGANEIVQSDLPVKEIVITANDQMKFDTEIIEAKAGQQVKLIFKNVGTMPKESMGHNWTLLDKNTDVPKFIEAGSMSPSTEYIAPEMAAKVLAQTKIIGPGESDTVTFTAPSIMSSYDYVCTFPGHFASGMKGKLVVQ